MTARAGVLVLCTCARVPFFEYSYSKPSVVGKLSYSLGCVHATRLKKQSSTRVLCLKAKQVVGQH